MKIETVAAVGVHGMVETLTRVTDDDGLVRMTGPRMTVLNRSDCLERQGISGQTDVASDVKPSVRQEDNPDK